MKSAMDCLRRRILCSRIAWNDEQGVALVAFMLIGVIMAMLGALMVDTAVTKNSHAARTVRVSTAYQGAEAAEGDYIAKLVEDTQYYLHFTHPAEATRRDPSGNLVAGGNTWNAQIGSWTYPNGPDRWKALGNGYEYNVMVEPPSPTVTGVKITTTSRRVGSQIEWRAVETVVRPSTVADYQMISDEDIAYGAAATTRGKIYAGINSGVKKSVNHGGIAHADVYAEGTVSGGTNFQSGAKGYDGNAATAYADIRTVIKDAIDFNKFTKSLVDIQNAAATGGILLNDSTVHAWKLVLNANATITVWKCTRAGSPQREVEDLSPTCVNWATFPTPANGAVYVQQDVIVQGIVDGRYTIASGGVGNDIVIGGDITYEVPGDDVLGLVAKDEMIVAHWVPSNLTWSAATIAQEGMWRSFNGVTHHGTMTFTGSTATKKGGYMSMFSTRNYNYDKNLAYLQPPYFPVLGDAYTILYSREVATGHP